MEPSHEGDVHFNRGLDYNMPGLFSLWRTLPAMGPGAALTIQEGVAKMLARRPPTG